MRIIAGLLFFALICEPVFLQADELERQSLFRIERSKNANILQYDAQIGPDGKLNKKEPVIVYWVRLAEQGQVKELSWIQRKFAFGFKAVTDRKSGIVTLHMSADIGQPIRVQHIDGAYRAMVDIDGKPSQLVKIYIQASRKGMSISVEFIEIYGIDLDTGDETYARFVP
jgi:hypothetical protein